MRSVINRLHSQNFTVLAPLLEGHGTTPEQCSQTRWPDWFRSAQKAYLELSAQCSRVFVCGLSLGALLTLKLAIEYPSLSGISCLATPLFFKPWVKNLLPIAASKPVGYLWKYQKKFGVDVKDPDAKANFWNYDLMPIPCINSIQELQILVEGSLSAVKSPALLVHSRHDSTAPYDSMSMVAKNISSPITESITLENSYHIITMDYEKEHVATKVSNFFTQFL